MYIISRLNAIKYEIEMYNMCHNMHLFFCSVDRVRHCLAGFRSMLLLLLLHSMALKSGEERLKEMEAEMAL